MSFEVGGIGGRPPGQIPGGIGPIGGDQEEVSGSDDQNVLDNINVLPRGEISIAVEQTDIAPGNVISRVPHPISGDEELLQGIGDPELNGPLGASSAMSAIEVSVEEERPSFNFSDDEIQISVEGGTAHVPLRLGEGDMQITIERQDQDDLVIQVDEEGKGLIDDAKHVIDADKVEITVERADQDDLTLQVDKKDEDNIEPKNPDSLQLRFYLKEIIENLERWIQQRMGR